MPRLIDDRPSGHDALTRDTEQARGDGSIAALLWMAIVASPIRCVNQHTVAADVDRR